MARSYRVKGKKYSQAKNIETFGYLDELEKVYDDPIAHFKQVVEERNLEEKRVDAEYTITARKGQRLGADIMRRMNYGYIIILSLFHELGLPNFLHNRRMRESKLECNTSSIMKLLVISRILDPGSMKRAFDGRGRYFDFENEGAFELADVYLSLSHFAKLDKHIKLLIHNRIKKNYGDGMIIDICKGLWRVEDSFWVSESELETCPIYLPREDHIKAHSLICFISLVVIRLIQKRTGYVHSPEKLIDTMNAISCSHEGGNLYLFDHQSEVSDSLGKAFGIDFSMLRLTRGEIKKNIGAVKNA